MYMPEALGELAALTKFIQLSLVMYMNEMDYD
jgi:hypothetical protein